MNSRVYNSNKKMVTPNLSKVERQLQAEEMDRSIHAQKQKRLYWVNKQSKYAKSHARTHTVYLVNNDPPKKNKKQVLPQKPRNLMAELLAAEEAEEAEEEKQREYEDLLNKEFPTLPMATKTHTPSSKPSHSNTSVWDNISKDLSFESSSSKISPITEEKRRCEFHVDE